MTHQRDEVIVHNIIGVKREDAVVTGRLDGKVALVSGSGRGIGRAVAEKLAAEGARVVINDLDAEPAKEVVAAIEAAGGQATACVGSVTAADFADRFVATAVDTYGGLDIIVNNAGYTWDNVIQKMTDQQWDDIIDVHLTAPFRILRAAQPVISGLAKKEKADGGPVSRRAIVNTSSTSGLQGNPGQVNYSTAKAGLIGMTKTLAKEWGRYNVTVNAIAYGVINTRLTTVTTEEKTHRRRRPGDQGRRQPGGVRGRDHPDRVGSRWQRRGGRRRGVPAVRPGVELHHRADAGVQRRAVSNDKPASHRQPPAYEEIDYRFDDGVAVIRFNAPKRRNALRNQMLRDLWEALDIADRDPAVRAVVLTGAGDHFCVGAELTGPDTLLEALEEDRDGHTPTGYRRAGWSGQRATVRHAHPRRRGCQRRRRRRRGFHHGRHRRPDRRSAVSVRFRVHPARSRSRERIVVVPAAVGGLDPGDRLGTQWTSVRRR